MSQAPRGKNDWIRDHYEKMILLVALIALLVSCVWLVQQIQSDKAVAEPSLARIGWKGDLVAPKDTVPFDAILAEARTAATAAQTAKARTTVSEMRVACVKCGRPIPYTALECPFCLAEQPPVVDKETEDTDVDGIPNKIELAWGLDPQNPADATGDFDRDGFSNLEEFRAKTDSKDAQSFPDPVVKLRVAVIKPVPFYLRFVGTSAFADGTSRYQLNLQSLTQTYFKQLNDEVMGYKITAYDKEGKGGETLTLVRQSDKRPVVLVKGRPITEQELVILFVSLIDRAKLPAQRLNDVFALRGTEYKVVDIRRESVVIRNVKNSEEVTVPMWSSEERAAFLGQPSAPAPAAVPGSVF